MNKKRIISAVFAILTVAITVFIFSNSLTVGEESQKQSDGIVDIVQDTLEGLGIDSEEGTLSFLIRKAGHFSEYFALSACAAIFLANTFVNKRLISLSLGYSLVVAICDEFIMQAITADRSPKFTDVLIDLSGALVAFAIVMLVLKKKKK